MCVTSGTNCRRVEGGLVNLYRMWALIQMTFGGLASFYLIQLM